MNKAAPPHRRLTNLPEALRARGFEPPAYRYLREAAINRVIPAQQYDGIWHYQPADIAVIERALKQTAGAAKIRRRSPAPETLTAA
jgi:hypothetical protein